MFQHEENGMAQSLKSGQNSIRINNNNNNNTKDDIHSFIIYGAKPYARVHAI